MFRVEGIAAKKKFEAIPFGLAFAESSIDYENVGEDDKNLCNGHRDVMLERQRDEVFSKVGMLVIVESKCAISLNDCRLFLFYGGNCQTSWELIT